MDSARWARIKTLYSEASARPVGERAAFLADACQGDDDLCREVEALLNQPVDTGDFRNFVEGASPLHSDRDLSGMRLGVFVLQGLIGRGGMGEVYRAHDTKLGRDVAIKVLPSEFTADERRLAGFEREARVVASLNHPHIAAIHGVEDSDGIRGLVLELVEGETLAERLERARTYGRSSFPVAEILGYARQIADALEAVHEKGMAGFEVVLPVSARY